MSDQDLMLRFHLKPGNLLLVRYKIEASDWSDWPRYAETGDPEAVMFVLKCWRTNGAPRVKFMRLEDGVTGVFTFKHWRDTFFTWRVVEELEAD